MSKILLSLTIWLRKYQGKGGNDYTIYNAASIIVVVQVLCLFLIKGFINEYENYPIDIGLVKIIIIFSSIFFG